MDLSLSDSRPHSSKWDESQSKCSGHCCSIDYHWKMSHSLSQASPFSPPSLWDTKTHNWIKLLLLVWNRLRCVSDVFMHELQNLFRRKQVDCTRQLLQTHFHFTVELFCKCAFVEHVVSFIAQTLNLKASCGVYWSPDPVLFSLNWFMDSINGAQAAGVHVGVHTGLTGIHHSDQVLYSIFSCFSMQQDLCRCCWLSAQPDPGLVCMQTLTYTHIHLQRQ